MSPRSARHTKAAGQRAHATPYAEARRAGRDALRDAVLQAAGDLLALDGAGALTMRRIADHIGASTTVLYSIFDSKSGILDAMSRTGHDTLRAKIEAIPASDPPLARLAASSRIYREFALFDPARYQLMFGNVVPAHRPGQAARDAARASFEAMEAIVRDCGKAGVLKQSADPRFAAEVLIAAAHGAVSLELSGHFDDDSLADERYAVLAAASLQPFLS